MFSVGPKTCGKPYNYNGSLGTFWSNLPCPDYPSLSRSRDEHLITMQICTAVPILWIPALSLIPCKISRSASHGQPCKVQYPMRTVHASLWWTNGTCGVTLHSHIVCDQNSMQIVQLCPHFPPWARKVTAYRDVLRHNQSALQPAAGSTCHMFASHFPHTDVLHIQSLSDMLSNCLIISG